MAFLVKAPFRWNECSKNVDISVLSNFLAILFEFFSRYREILPSTIYMPNFRLIGPFKQELQREDRICPLPPAIPICKQPGLFRVKFLQMPVHFADSRYRLMDLYENFHFTIIKLLLLLSYYYYY